jgi:hypothetical protein
VKVEPSSSEDKILPADAAGKNINMALNEIAMINREAAST